MRSLQSLNELDLLVRVLHEMIDLGYWQGILLSEILKSTLVSSTFTSTQCPNHNQEGIQLKNVHPIRVDQHKATLLSFLADQTHLLE